MTPTTLTQPVKSTIIITTTTKTVPEPRNRQKMFSHLVRYMGKQTTPQRNAILEPMQPIDSLPGTKDRKDRAKSQREPTKVTLKKFLKNCSPRFKLMPRLHSGAATDRHETTNFILPPIPEIVWQQPQDTQLTNFHKTPNTQTHKSIYMPESKQRHDVESQLSPMKETSSQVSESSREPLLGNETGRRPVQRLNDAKESQSEIQRQKMNMTANDKGEDNISPPKVTNSQIEEQLVRDDITNELHMPLSSTIVLKRKKEMLYVPLDSENGLTIDALVDSRAYVSAIAQTELDKIKQQAPANNFEIDDQPNFQIQVANGQLEQPI